MLDASGATDMHPKDFQNAVNGLLASTAFGIMDSADGYILLRRGATNTQLPDTFYDFARAREAQPQQRVDVVFGEALKLVGYDLVPDARRHRVQSRWYWQALKPLDPDVRVYPFYHDASGKVIEDTSQRPMVATLWYPLARWQPSEVVVTETLPWDVGDAFSLAVGVMHGNDWERVGRRLSLADGRTQLELGHYAWRGKQLVPIGSRAD
ncbi:MAG: hypothetical protein LC737_06225, partial [Chloroflexi bacterium]|nr:hypothetical protein [Chloroflexota bacterium]